MQSPAAAGGCGWLLPRRVSTSCTTGAPVVTSHPSQASQLLASIMLPADARCLPVSSKSEHARVGCCAVWQVLCLLRLRRRPLQLCTCPPGGQLVLCIRVALLGEWLREGCGKGFFTWARLHALLSTSHLGVAALCRPPGVCSQGPASKECSGVERIAVWRLLHSPSAPGLQCMCVCRRAGPHPKVAKPQRGRACWPMAALCMALGRQRVST